MIHAKHPKSSVERVSNPNEDGFVTIDLSIGNHGEAVTVIGEGYDEALTRALIIRDALRKNLPNEDNQ